MRRLGSDTLVIASHNRGKIVEIADLLRPYGVAVKSSADLGFDVPEETEDTFAGNARIKAHAAAKASGLPALSDDSGLAVDALDGAPGVHTADWAETETGRDFVMAMEKVWTLLEDRQVPEPRIAHFHAVLCLAWPDGHDEIFDGRVSGRLVWPMRGDKGFGFDPMFLPQGEVQTFGEMAPAEKHAMSHRAEAFRKLVAACFG